MPPLAQLPGMLDSLAYRNDAAVVHVNTSLNARAYWRDIAYVAVAKLLGARVIATASAMPAMPTPAERISGSGEASSPAVGEPRIATWPVLGMPMPDADHHADPGADPIEEGRIPAEPRDAQDRELMLRSLTAQLQDRDDRIRALERGRLRHTRLCRGRRHGARCNLRHRPESASHLWH